MKTTVIGNVTFDMFDISHQERNENRPKFFDALKCEMVEAFIGLMYGVKHYDVCLPESQFKTPVTLWRCFE